MNYIGFFYIFAMIISIFFIILLMKSYNKNCSIIKECVLKTDLFFLLFFIMFVSNFLNLIMRIFSLEHNINYNLFSIFIILSMFSYALYNFTKKRERKYIEKIIKNLRKFKI